MFFDFEPMSDEDYAALPPLVKKGQDREEVIKTIVVEWCTPSGAVGTDDAAVEDYVKREGSVLDGIALTDENTGEPIDLGELLKRVEERLRANGEPEAFRSRPDLFILLHRCRVDRCNCEHLKIRPHFVAFQTKFGDGANFSRATFGRGARFAESRYGDGANFSVALFGDRANFRHATFGDQADFGGARFGDRAIFLGARFGDAADFVEVRLGDGADFRLATFSRNASFRRTYLPNADLRDANGFIPDETFIRNTHFSARARDPWSKLRADFTGPRLIFNLLFLTLFFLPFIARTAGYYAAGHTQEKTVAIVESMDERLIEAEPEHPHLVPLLRGQVQAIREQLPDRHRENDERWRESRVWRAVLAVDRGWWFWLPALILLIYNIGRAGMTFIVPAVRDAEERSGITPAFNARPWEEVRLMRRISNVGGGQRRHARVWDALADARDWALGYSESYGWLIWPHRVLKVLLWMAILSFLWNAWLWLTMPIWLPA